jgi:hypothetical protein
MAAQHDKYVATGADHACRADGKYGDVPYRVADTGQIDALISGQIVSLNTIEDLVAFASTRSAWQHKNIPADPHLLGSQVSAAPPETDTEAPTPSAVAVVLKRPRRRRRIFFWIAVVPVLLYFIVTFFSGGGAVARKAVELINSEYASICHAELEGIGSDTLKIDWTSRATKLNAAMVLAAVGTVKETLYKDGVGGRRRTVSPVHY